MKLPLGNRQSIKYSTSIKYLIVFFVIISTDTVSLPFEDKNVVTVFIAITGVLTYLMHLLKVHGKIESDEALFVLLVCVCCLIAQVVNWDSSFAYEVKITQILLGFIIAKMISFDQFSEVYVNIMCFIAVVAIVVYLSVVLGLTWWRVLPLTNNDQHYSFLFTVVPVNLAHRFRLWGPFWEPGVFQSYLNIAILFAIQKKTSRKKIVVLSLAIILSLSTTGYICLFMILLIYLNSRKWRMTAWQWALSLIVLLAIIFIMQNEYIQTSVFGKFQVGSLGSSSFTTRLKNIQIYFYEGIRTPLFGAGITESYNNVVNQYSLLSVFNTYNGDSYAGSTSTTMREFAGLGGVVCILRVVLQYKFSKKINTNTLSKWLTFVLFLILLNTEDFIYSMFFNMIFIYGLESIKDDFSITKAGDLI